MYILCEIVATDMSSDIYEGSFANQNVYYNLLMQTRGIHEAESLIEKTVFILPLQPQ